MLPAKERRTRTGQQLSRFDQSLRIDRRLRDRHHNESGRYFYFYSELAGKERLSSHRAECSVDFVNILKHTDVETRRPKQHRAHFPFLLSRNRSSGERASDSLRERLDTLSAVNTLSQIQRKIWRK